MGTKKLITAVFAFSVLCTASADAQSTFSDAATFPDWSAVSIGVVKDKGIMTGFGDGTFQAEKPLSRAEMVAILLRTKSIEAQDVVGSNLFRDVPSNAWFTKGVIEAANRGWIDGYSDGSFRPAQIINRAEFATIIARAFGLLEDGVEYAHPGFSDVPSQIWYTDAVAALAGNDLIRTARSETYNPGEAITRAEAAWTVAQILARPRLMNISATNDTENDWRRSSRRVAIRPRDFEPGLQGYDIPKQEIRLDVFSGYSSLDVRPDQGFQEIGKVRVTNALENSRSTLGNIVFKMRFDKESMGPRDLFEMQIIGPGFTVTKSFSSTGVVNFTGLDMRLVDQDEAVLQILLNAQETGNYYDTEGTGHIWLYDADGTTVNMESGMATVAPVGFENRDFPEFSFSPRAQE